jgi:hypothetical protein
MTFFNIYLVPYLFIDYIEIFTLKYLIPFINFINKCKNNKRIININILPDDIEDETDNVEDETDNVEDKPDDVEDKTDNVEDKDLLNNNDLLNIFDTFNKNLLFYTMIQNIDLGNEDDNDDDLNEDNEVNDNLNEDDNDDDLNEVSRILETKYISDIYIDEVTESSNETEDEESEKENDADNDEESEISNESENYNDLKELVVILDKNENTEDIDTNSDIIIVENIE